jgi:hypothetical protein
MVPASAARLEACSGPNLMKTESSLELMADGDAKWQGYKEMAAAQTAMLDGNMGACASHLTKVVQIETTK